MKPGIIHIIGLTALMAAGEIFPARTAAAASARTNDPGFEFQDIFNPNRNPQPTNLPPPPPKIDSFRLTGTLISGDGSYAFFEGSLVRRRGAALTPNAKIDGFTIAAIAGDGVRLESPGNQTITMPVGAQMRRVDEGPWTLAPAAASGKQR